MPWSRATQRVLLALAAALIALGAFVVGNPDQRPTVSILPDDPRLDVRLDLNSATAGDLETLPGVGVSLAGRIVDYRSAHGPFTSVDELRQVPGFGEKLVTALRPLVSVRR